MEEGGRDESETKKMINVGVNVNPRVQIDTSAPFESVKEAVDRFGGSGPWVPVHLLRFPPLHHDANNFDMDKMEEQAALLERDLIMKERETLNVLKELEEAKRLVEGLKAHIVHETPTAFMSSPRNGHTSFPNDSREESLTLCPVQSPGLMAMELNQAKSELTKTSTDLASIRASVESLNKRMRRDKALLERKFLGVLPGGEGSNESRGTSITNQNAERMCSLDVAEGFQQLNFEAEQFKKMAEGSRYEVMKAMAEIERTKTSIKMAEMRLHAAKKMEEAAKAVEAIAFAERKALLNGEKSPDVHNNDGITLSFEEYRALTLKAKQAEELCRTKFIDNHRTNQSEVTVLKKTIEETKHEKKSTVHEDHCLGGKLVAEDVSCRQNSVYNSTNFKFRNSQSSLGDRSSQLLEEDHPSQVSDESDPVYRSTLSIGDVLSRKLILQDDIMVRNHAEGRHERQHTSLSQMLREQTGLILHRGKQSREGSVHKQYFSQRKKFGFIHVALTKHSKKKTRDSNTT